MKRHAISIVLTLCYAYNSMAQPYNLSDIRRVLRTDKISQTGLGMTLYIYEPGIPLSAHQEFGNRILPVIGWSVTPQITSHATSVAGIALAGGVRQGATGVASQALGKMMDYRTDLTDLVSDLPFGSLVVSNHSYGSSEVFMDANPWRWGAYTDESRLWDSASYKRLGWLGVTSIGNSGDAHNPNARSDGFDVIPGGNSTAKNILTVTESEWIDVDAAGNFVSGTVPDESSAGPTADLRIKPDIAGFSDHVISCSPASRTAYEEVEGTSMASAGVAAGLLLLQQRYSEKFITYMRAASLKGLALHTADDLNSGGPDLESGWGLFNAKAAANVIDQRRIPMSNVYMEELTMDEADVYHKITVPSMGRMPIIASISWTDPAGKAVSRVINSVTPVLVNDLDLRVIGPMGAEVSPYKITYDNNTGFHTVLGDNIRDPFERVDVNGTVKGSYTIKITHKAGLRYGTQKYTLIITGIEDDCNSNAVLVNSIGQGLQIKRRNIEIDGDMGGGGGGGAGAMRIPINVVATEGIRMLNGAYLGLGLDLVATISGCNPVGGSLAALAMPRAAEKAEVPQTSPEYPLANQRIFPNPANDRFKLEYRSASAGHVTVRIYTVAGALANETSASAAAGLNTLDVSVASLPPNTYIVRLDNGGIQAPPMKLLIVR